MVYWGADGAGGGAVLQARDGEEGEEWGSGELGSDEYMSSDSWFGIEGRENGVAFVFFLHWLGAGCMCTCWEKGALVMPGRISTWPGNVAMPSVRKERRSFSVAVVERLVAPEQSQFCAFSKERCLHTWENIRCLMLALNAIQLNHATYHETS